MFWWLLGQLYCDPLCGTKVLWKKDYQRIVANREFLGVMEDAGCHLAVLVCGCSFCGTSTSCRVHSLNHGAQGRSKYVILNATNVAYLRNTQKPFFVRYILEILGLGLMAKPMLVTLPFVLLLLDYWPLGRLRLENSLAVGRLVWE